MELLNPVQIITNEGLKDAIKFFWNVATQPVIRHQIFAIRRFFKIIKKIWAILFYVQNGNSLSDFLNLT